MITGRSLYFKLNGQSMCFLLYLGILFTAGTLAMNHEEDTKTINGAGYAMYVWTNGFDRTVPGCDENEFLTWNTHGKCFTHTWDTAPKRQWLWDTCNVPGREVSAIFLSGFHHILQDAYDSKDCNTSGIQMVRKALTEGHMQVPGLKIYGLFAVDDRGVSEQNLVKYIVYYNDVCARSQSEKLDGVATNNEKYAEIKCADDVTRVRYLDNLKNIVTEARKQRQGTLLTHYSVSWHWGQCTGGNNMITWNHKTQNASLHMIDIFDSIDVQVGYIIFPEIARRLKLAGYDYARTLGKRFYATFYTDKTSPCQTTFFPQSCRVHGHTEAGLFKVIDGFSANDISYAKPCIHYFRGVYSSGGNPDWPKHSRTGNGQPIVG